MVFFLVIVLLAIIALVDISPETVITERLYSKAGELLS